MPHRSRLAGIVIDCQGDDLGQAVQFWSGVFGGEFRPVEDGKYAELEGAEERLQVLLQHVDHSSRVHIDIETDDQEAEARRVEALGAKLVERHPKGWIVMEAPTGQRFCLVGPQHGDFPAKAMVWED